jgi:hypothetical protein
MIDLSDRALQGLAVLCVAALGAVALLTQSDYSQTIVIAVSAFLGALARHFWPDAPTTIAPTEAKV